MKQATFFGVLATAFFLNSCGKDDDDSTVLAGGKGGSASLRVTTRHHSRMIDSCMVYIKYAANARPAAFDDSARVVRGTADTVAVFSGLKAGNYYFYGQGWDLGIAREVVGGIPFTVPTDGQIYNVFCPVSDDH